MKIVKVLGDLYTKVPVLCTENSSKVDSKTYKVKIFKNWYRGSIDVLIISLRIREKQTKVCRTVGRPVDQLFLIALLSGYLQGTLFKRHDYKGNSI